MRPVREITAKEENYRTRMFARVGRNVLTTSKRDPVEPEPVGGSDSFSLNPWHDSCQTGLVIRDELCRLTGGAYV